MTTPRAVGPVVHVSADYPDTLVPAKTRAIESLVHLVEHRFDQRVISLNRKAPGKALGPAMLARPFAPRLPIAAARADGAVLPVEYTAPGKGLYHATMLRRLGDWLADHLARGDTRPGLLVAHKLSVEGLAVAHAARLLGVPFALTIQGNSDGKILAMRPDLRAAFADVFHRAAVVFHFAPWALAVVSARLGRREGPVVLVPCPVANDSVIAPQAGGDGLVSAFHLRNHRIKNLDRLASASSRVARMVPGAALAIIGGGSEADTAICRKIIARHPCRMEGPLPLDAIPARFNRASGFVMPSRRESFGLVFIEALFAGCPIIYPAGRAVDGLFDAQPFALRVDHRDPSAIADAMARLLRDEAAIKHALAQWQASDARRQFCRDRIAAAFGDGLALALRGQSAGAVS